MNHAEKLYLHNPAHGKGRKPGEVTFNWVNFSPRDYVAKIYSTEFQIKLQEVVGECGDYIRHVVAQSKIARELGDGSFKEVDYEKLKPGIRKKVFSFHWKEELHHFWVGNKIDHNDGTSSPVTSVDIYIHDRLKSFFDEHLPGLPFISEENKFLLNFELMRDIRK
jgi:hypothetical protein